MEVILWSVLLGFAILVTAVVVSLYYRHKYAPIFRQLSDLLADQEKVVNKISEKPAHETGITTDNHPHISQIEIDQDDKFMRRNYEIDFKKLTDAIRDEQLYTTPKFGRKDLMHRFHMTGKSISTAFSVNGTSVPEFIRECRLEHARKLMVDRPDMTLVEIATASGFVHASTFTVDFKNKYGVSPTKYREQARSDELRSES